MADIIYDWPASDLASANRDVVKVMIQHLEKVCAGDMPAAAIRTVKQKLQTLSPLCDFHKDIANGIVQVDVNFEGTINRGTSLLREGYTWQIRFTIDADIPPSFSTQKKHIGFEIHFKTKSKQAGHAWCDAVPKGRPGTGVGMKETTEGTITETFPNTDTLKYSITTYTLR